MDGVLILVKRTLESFVVVIDFTLDKIVLLKLDKTVFSSDKHVILCGAYVCPPDSPYYKHSQGAITSSNLLKSSVSSTVRKNVNNSISCCVVTLM